MSPRSHVQFLCNPFQRHCRLHSQALRDPNFLRITLRTLRQLCPRPAELVQFFIQDTARFFFRGLAARLCVMTFRGARVGGFRRISIRDENDFSSDKPREPANRFGASLLLRRPFRRIDAPYFTGHTSARDLTNTFFIHEDQHP